MCFRITLRTFKKQVTVQFFHLEEHMALFCRYNVQTVSGAQTRFNLKEQDAEADHPKGFKWTKISWTVLSCDRCGLRLGLTHHAAMTHTPAAPSAAMQRAQAGRLPLLWPWSPSAVWTSRQRSRARGMRRRTLPTNPSWARLVLLLLLCLLHFYINKVTHVCNSFLLIIYSI